MKSIRFELSKLFLLLLGILISLSSCKQKKTYSSSFKQEIKHLLNDSGTSPADHYSANFQAVSKNFFIQFIDGQCQLCALDLREIDNLNNNYFKSNNIIPLVFIYGKMDPYISDLIEKKSILTYPIFTLEPERYNYLKEKFGLHNNSYLVDQNYKLTFKGNPLKNNNDLNKLSSVINDL